MDDSEHYQNLASMYLAAPINKIYKPEISIRKGEAEITMSVIADFHHAAGAAHGSVYFKMLDDAAFFAASSLEKDVFVLTASLTTYLTKPISTGTMKSVGKVVNQTKTQFIVEAIAFNEEGREIARANGIMVRGKLPLHEAAGYAS